jgi:OmpA-OmpF porin, OOP family
MKNKQSGPALVVALVLTAGLCAGGFWLLGRVAPGLLTPLTQSPALEDDGGISQGTDTLRILGDTFSGYSTFRSAAFQDALKTSGLKLNYQDEFDQTKRAERLNRGDADLLVTTLDQFVKQKPQGKIVGLIDRTVGADAVVLNTKQFPQLKSLLDLNKLVAKSAAEGKQLGMAYAGDTPSEYLALVLSTKFDAFKLENFQTSRVADASEAWKLLQDRNKNLAIAVLWEPYVTQARQQGNTVVLSSKDAPNTIIDVLVASDRLLQSQPEQVSAFLEAYYRRIDANVRDASQLQRQIAEDGKLPPADAAAVLSGIDFFTASEAKAWLTDGTLVRRINSTAAVLVISGKMDAVPANAKALFDPALIIKAATNTQTLIELVRADNPELADRLAGKGTALSSSKTLTASQIKAAPDIGNLKVRGQVNFAAGSASLTPESVTTLKGLAQEIDDFSPQTVAVRVIGHTSQTGSAAVNQSLSQERAQVVVDYLKQQGIKHNILAEGRGFSQPLSGIPASDARNQRTEIRLVRGG